METKSNTTLTSVRSKESIASNNPQAIIDDCNSEENINEDEQAQYIIQEITLFREKSIKDSHEPKLTDMVDEKVFLINDSKCRESDDLLALIQAKVAFEKLETIPTTKNVKIQNNDDDNAKKQNENESAEENSSNQSAEANLLNGLESAKRSEIEQNSNENAVTNEEDALNTNAALEISKSLQSLNRKFVEADRALNTNVSVMASLLRSLSVLWTRPDDCDCEGKSDSRIPSTDESYDCDCDADSDSKLDSTGKSSIKQSKSGSSTEEEDIFQSCIDSLETSESDTETINADQDPENKMETPSIEDDKNSLKTSESAAEKKSTSSKELLKTGNENPINNESPTQQENTLSSHEDSLEESKTDIEMITDDQDTENKMESPSTEYDEESLEKIVALAEELLIELQESLKETHTESNKIESSSQEEKTTSSNHDLPKIDGEKTNNDQGTEEQMKTTSYENDKKSLEPVEPMTEKLLKQSTESLKKPNQNENTTIEGPSSKTKKDERTPSGITTSKKSSQLSSSFTPTASVNENVFEIVRNILHQVDQLFAKKF